MPHPPREGRVEESAKQAGSDPVRRRRPMGQLLVVALLVLALFIAGWWVTHRGRASGQPAASYTPGHAALLATYVEDLPDAPRLSGTGVAAKRTVGGRGFDTLGFAGGGIEDRILAEAQVEREGTESPSSEALAAGGIRSLLRGRIEEAVRVLELAHGASPEDPRILNDLSAALLLRAERDGRPEDLVFAWETASRALSFDPKFVEARFNLALALESLFLRSAARAAWEAYLELDGSSPWAVEAREHLRTLERLPARELWEGVKTPLVSAAERGEDATVSEIVRSYPKESRELAEDELLGAWAEAALQGQFARADRLLTAARSIAEALAGANGEFLLLDGIQVAEDMARNHPEGQRALARGHRAYRQARTLYLEHRETEAAELFEEARTAFRSSGSPMAAWCTFYLVVRLYRQGELENALGALTHLASEADRGRSPSLVGRVHWLQGLVLLTEGKPLASLAAYRAALLAFEGAHLAAEQATVHALLAENYSYLGEGDKAWRHMYWALAATDELAEDRGLDVTMSEAAELLDSDHSDLAVLFHDEVAALASEVKDPLPIAHALLRRSRAHLARGDLEQAESDLKDAAQALSRVEDRTLRERIEGDLAHAEGDLLLAIDPVRAIGFLTGAVEHYESADNRFALVPALVSRARARVGVGELEGAAADFRHALRVMRVQVRGVRDPSFEAGFVEDVRAFLEEMIRRQLELNRGEVALEYSDLGRSLLNTRRETRRGAEVPEAAGALRTGISHELPQVLPASTVLVEYFVLPDRLAIWAVSRDGVLAVEQPSPKATLLDLVQAFQEAVARSEDSTARSIGADLFELLIRPVAAQLPPETRLIVVPDGPLHGLPFAALVDRSTGRFLVEDHTIVLAESGFRLLHGARSAGDPKAKRQGSALVIGNPLLEASASAVLTSLREAEREAELVGEAIPGSLVLVRSSATRLAFLEKVGDYPIAHLATHAVTNRRFPELSYLALATDAGELAPFYAHEIRSLDLQGVRLVVLTGCNTSTVPGGEPPVTALSAAFLTAGASAVVGTLWEVEDRATRWFFDAFYGQLARGAEPAGALRHSQLRMLETRFEESWDISDWAGFRLSSWHGLDQGKDYN